MQTYIYIIAMLVTLQPFVQVTGIDTTTEATIHTTVTNASQQTDSVKQTHLDSNLINSDSKHINENEASKPSMKLDPETEVIFKNSLLSIMGVSKRPKPIERSKHVIPDSMKKLWTDLTSEELRESVNLPKPGLHTKSANTVRSFTHEGMYLIENK